MPLRDDLLTPIKGDNPSGENLRYDPVYDEIKEARREEDDLEQGAWKHERTVADPALVIKLSQEAIATRSKDLQLAAWLTEALLRQEGFGGLLAGLRLCHDLLTNFWDTLYPEIEDGDEELRAMPLEWLNLRLEQPLRLTPVVNAGYHWYDYGDSRNVVGYEENAPNKEAKKKRQQLIDQGKVAPEDFDKAFEETPKTFYLEAEKNLDAVKECLKELDGLCEEKFTEEPPSYGKLETAVDDVRHLIHALLEKRRETEPDPVEEEVAEELEEGAELPGAEAVAAVAAKGLVIPTAATEPANRREAVTKVAEAARTLRNLEPASPAPYLMLRGLRWGELRAAMAANDLARLEAPPTELRQHIKSLALKNKWEDLLAAAEEAMSLPCSRGWLDLQRFVVEACAALGSDYDLIAKAIRSELRAVIRDVPEIARATLLDDTPAANPETRTWLRQLTDEPEETGGQAEAAEGEAPAAEPPPAVVETAEIGWKRTFVDPQKRASEAFRAGEDGKALEILQKEIDRQRSGRGRFLKKLQMVELCVIHGKEEIAQPLLDDLSAAIDEFKLEAWEDREIVTRALLTIMKSSEAVSGDAKAQKKMFERICRLDPAKALEC